ncbi:MAG TPA: Ig-like domain-containing protein [Chitinophagaceae bacterium]|nr:Ig-like domain-containing protein [Chitinophagaceae bacterium]
MEIILLKQPYSVSFSGNPLAFSFAVTPYGDTERKQNIRLIVKVLVEKLSGSGLYDEVKSSVFFPDAEGMVSMDVKSLIEPYLHYYQPRPDLTIPLKTPQQQCRYKVSWLLEKDGVPVGDAAESNAYHCLKGGMALEEWHPSEYFTIVAAVDHQPLNFFAQDKIAVSDLRFLSWIYPFADTEAQAVQVLIKGSDGTIYTFENNTTVNGEQWAVFCAPIKLSTHALPVGVFPVEACFKVLTASHTVVQTAWKKIEQRNFYEQHTLLYRGSTGALETLYLRGQVDYEADYERTSVSRTLPPSAFKNLSLLPSKKSSSQEAQKWKGDTGFQSKAAINRLRDLLLSDEVYAYRGGKFIPVEIASKNAKFYSNKDNLISLQLEWTDAHSNRAFTPAGMMPSARTCPAMEKFEVVQLNKKTLQIMYALPIPYDECEVAITINGTTDTYRYSGNTRVIRQEFTNPITSGTLDISLTGCVVCNPTTGEKGPVSNKALTIYGNAAVVANPDVFTIQNGFSSAITLPKSVLDNDYDPDGDALTVTAASGATTAGGSFNINTAGIVQYTPPSSAYVGTDTFTYQVNEAGGTSTTQTVTIHVGTVATTVYAKVVKRNTSTSQGTIFTLESGQIWLEFFSDPAGTIPYDISALNLTINYEKKVISTGSFAGNDSTQNLSHPGTGISVKVYEGALTRVSSFFGSAGTLSAVFRTLPGTGYTAI